MFKKKQESNYFSEKFQKSEAEKCLKKQEFQGDCVYKLGVYKKNCVLFKNSF